jgi:hypothetical protein
MNKGFATVVAAVSGLVAFVPVAAAGAGQWSVTGSGFGGGPVAGDHLELAAHSDVGGTDPSGHAENQFTVTTPERFNDGGQVICLNVVGNRAVVVWQLRNPVTIPEQGKTYPYGAAVIEDNGEPVAGQPVDRMLDFIVSPPNLAFFCSPDALGLIEAFGATPLERGNFVIRDS